MRVLPVADKAMLLLSGEEEIVVVADLHIGLEAHLSWRGFHIPSQTEKMERELIQASAGKDALVILGDVKHRVPGSTRQEHREIPRFFRRMTDAYPRVEVVRGNHDGGLEEFLPEDVSVHPASGLRLNDVGLLHGHTLPSKRLDSCDTLICGHNHSRMAFMSPQGSGPTEPCWLRVPYRPGETKELIVLPAFNPNLGGSPVNIEGEGFLGPVLNNPALDIDNALVYLLDGAALGRLKDLRVPGRKYKKRKVL